MVEQFFTILTHLDDLFWGYCAFVFIMVCGLLLTIRSGFFQIRAFPKICKIFFQYLGKPSESERGVHPLKAFFASTGGMIGIGNVVGVVTAIQLGGPGALFWVWVAGMVGAIVKYCEIYLGLKYRQKNKEGSYDGGPMYFLKKAFKSKLLPLAVAGLLCVYGVEIYQFSVITESVSSNWHVHKLIVIALLIGSVIWAGVGGVQRIGKICTWVMPFFLLLYFLMGFWVIFQEIGAMPAILSSVFHSAFTGHAAVGGFAGSSMIMAIQYGMARAAYSADIGIGYDSIIQSESSAPQPEKQASLAILGVAIDNLICTFSILIVLASGAWSTLATAEGSQLIQTALSKYFPLMQFFVPMFFVVTGYTTIIAFFVVGIKCAKYLAPRFGKQLYIVYAIASFSFFSFVPQYQALLMMSVSGALLLMINLLGIYRLRKEIVFDQEAELLEKAA